MTEPRKWIRVAVSVTTDQPELATRAIETFNRTAVGLALDGAEVTVVAGPDWETDDDLEPDEEQP